MRKLADIHTLKGQALTITLTELRKSPGEVFTQVAMGAEFTVTKSGKGIAKITPIELNALELGAACRHLR